MCPIRCEKLLEGDGIIMLLVFGAVYERHRPVAHMRHELLDRGAVLGPNLAKTKILAKYNTINQVDRLHGGTKPVHPVRE
jgi:hypothetical protein